MHIWALIFIVLGGIGTYFGLLDGKTESESESKGGCLLALSIVIAIIFFAVIGN